MGRVLSHQRLNLMNSCWTMHCTIASGRRHPHPSFCVASNRCQLFRGSESPTSTGRFTFDRYKKFTVTKNWTVTKVGRYIFDRYTFWRRLRNIRPLQNRYTIESFRVPPKKYFTDSYICVVTTLGPTQQANPVFPVLFYLYIGRTKPKNDTQRSRTQRKGAHLLCARCRSHPSRPLQVCARRACPHTARAPAAPSSDDRRAPQPQTRSRPDARP
jgi:hypothetical protein